MPTTASVQMPLMQLDAHDVHTPLPSMYVPGGHETKRARAAAWRPDASGTHCDVFHTAMLLTVRPSMVAKLPDATRLPWKIVRESTELPKVLPEPNAAHAVPLHWARLLTVFPPAMEKYPPTTSCPL